MTTVENLTQTVAEECAEVAQRASKANRFGWFEVQDGQQLSNSERLISEFIDLSAVLLLLEEEGLCTFPFKVVDSNVKTLIMEKQLRIRQMLDYSKQLGLLND